MEDEPINLIDCDTIVNSPSLSFFHQSLLPIDFIQLSYATFITKNLNSIGPNVTSSSEPMTKVWIFHKLRYPVRILLKN